MLGGCHGASLKNLSVLQIQKPQLPVRMYLMYIYASGFLFFEFSPSAKFLIVKSVVR